MPKMTSTFPTSSKLLERKWRDRAYKSHQDKMHSMKSGVDNGSPQRFPHLMLRLKKLQVEEEKQSRVEYDNTILLAKMTGILKGRGKIDNWNEYESGKSLNTNVRLRELEKIAKQNAVISKSLRRTRSLYNASAWEEDYKRKSKLMSMWNESTKDFGISYNTSTHPQRSQSFQGRHNLGKSRLSSNSDETTSTDASVTGAESEQSDQVTRLPKITKSTKHKQSVSVIEDDAKTLFRAIKNLIPASEGLNKTLIKRSRLQRLHIKSKFKEMFDLELASELRDVLGSDYNVLITALLGDTNTMDAVNVNKAIELKDVAGLVETVCTKNNSAMSSLNDAYRKKYNSSIEDDLKSNFEGEESLLFLVTLYKDGRPETSEINEEEAEKEAQKLYESGDGRWTSDSGVFIKLLEGHSFLQVRATIDAFKQYNAGTGIGAAVAGECTAEFAKGVRKLEKCLGLQTIFYAEKFHNIMDPSNPEFIQLLVSRFDIDLQDIRKAYKKRYSHDLPADIKSKYKADIGVTLSLLASSSPADKNVKGQGARSKVSAVHVRSPPKRSPVKRPDGKSKTLDNVRTNPLQTSKEKKAKSSEENKKPAEKPAKQKPDPKKKTVSKPPPKTSGTIHGTEDFNADDDMTRVEEALAGWGADEEPLIEILSTRNNEQRQQIKKRYMNKHKKDLKSVLESELGGDFEDLIVALMMTPSRFDAFCLHEAMVGLGTKESTIIGILVTRTAKELKAINQQYLKAYGKNLNEDLKGDTSGSFAELVLQLNKGERDQTFNVNLAEAEEDAKKLHRDGKNIFEAEDKTFQDILTKRNRQQAKAIFDEYESLTGHTLIQGIKDATIGDLEDALIALVKATEDPISFYAERIHEAMEGIGTDDQMLIRLIVSRSEIDLVDVKVKYQDTYSESLEERIEKECSGSYKKLLLAIIKDK